MRSTDIFILVCCIALGQVELSAGLRCYNCEYIEGDLTTSQTCHLSPQSWEQGEWNSARNANRLNSGETMLALEGSTSEFSGSVEGNVVVATANGTEPRVTYIYCMTLTGILNGKKYVKRGALTTTELIPQDQICRGNQPTNTTLVEYPRTCFCKGATCNVGKWDSEAIGGITCHQCTYIQGDSTTSATCETYPTSTEIVFSPGHPALDSTSSATSILTQNNLMFSKAAGIPDYLSAGTTGLSNSLGLRNGTAKSPNFPYTYCYVLMGQLNGKKYVRRNALDTDAVYAADFCEDGMPNLPITLTNPRMCMCKTSRCNIGDWTWGKPTTTTTTTTTTTPAPTTPESDESTTTTAKTNATTTTTTKSPPTTPEPEEPTTPEEEECPTEDPVTEAPVEGTTTEASEGNSTQSPTTTGSPARARRMSRKTCGAGGISLSAILFSAGLIFTLINKTSS